MAGVVPAAASPMPAAPGTGCGDDTAPLGDISTAPFAVAAAALSAARLSLVSSILQAPTTRTSAAVAVVHAYLTPCLISPSVWVTDDEQGKRRAGASVRVGSSPGRGP